MLIRMQDAGQALNALHLNFRVQILDKNPGFVWIVDFNLDYRLN